MNNLKTAVIVVLLLGALYGAYQYLNQRDVTPPPEVLLQQEQGIAPPMIEFGGPAFSGPVEIPSASSSAAPSSAGPYSGVPTTVSPAEGYASASPASSLSPPSFAVLPTASDSAPYDALPPAGATFPEASEPPVPGLESPGYVTGAPVTSAAVDVPAPSAYVDGRAATAANSASDPISSYQTNPWQRPARPETTPGVPARQLGRGAFDKAWSEARDLVERGKFPEALAALTVFHDSPDLSESEHRQLLKTLDSLAGRVIYSTEHYLEEPYVVRVDETLMDIAQRYNVPYQLLQNINGIKDPLVLAPRSKLKVLRGPFRAELNLTTGELSLFVDKYYAGRFPTTLGQDPSPQPGEYAVKMKRDGKDYYLPNGTIREGDRNNPYGQFWIDLGQGLCIHGSPLPTSNNQPPKFQELGCISLSPVDAADVYGILSEGSPVTIRR